MCGLFGYTFKKPAGLRLAIVLSHYADQRGGHAYGYLSPGSGKVVKGLGGVLRHAGRIASMAQVMAHTRYATQGANVVENAHPFKRGDVTLAHNGQVYNGGEQYAVDSMELAERVACGLPIDDLAGYGVITWHKTAKKGRIYLAKLTDSGQVSVAMTKRGPIYASTRDAVESACEAAGLTIKHWYAISTGTVYFLDVSGLYTTGEPELRMSDKYTYSGFEWEGGTANTIDLSGPSDDGAVDRDSMEWDLQCIGYSAGELAGLSDLEVAEAWERETEPLPFTVQERRDAMAKWERGEVGGMS